MPDIETLLIGESVIRGGLRYSVSCHDNDNGKKWRAMMKIEFLHTSYIWMKIVSMGRQYVTKYLSMILDGMKVLTLVKILLWCWIHAWSYPRIFQTIAKVTQWVAFSYLINDNGQVWKTDL